MSRPPAPDKELGDITGCAGVQKSGVMNGGSDRKGADGVELQH